MNCKCFDEVDEKLRAQNLKLVGYAFIMPSFSLTPTVATQWIDKAKAPAGKKRTPPYVFASHCPFCGKPVKKGGAR